MADYDDSFCDATIGKEFYKTGKPSGGPGEYNGEKTGPFGEFKRTTSPNGVDEKIRDGRVPSVSGEPDQMG